jgi:hypothetical protein
MLVALLALQVLVSFATVARGPDSGIDESRQVVIRTATEWQALWKAHGAGRASPVVDFARSVVVGVFLGSRATAGYEVTITAVKSQDGKTVVEYVERRPDAGAIVAQVLTSPFHLVSIPEDRANVDDVDFRNIDR